MRPKASLEHSLLHLAFSRLLDYFTAQQNFNTVLTNIILLAFHCNK